jgi:hypothetical protein
MKPDRSAADREVARCDGGNRPDAANECDSSDDCAQTLCPPSQLTVSQSHAVACSLHRAMPRPVRDRFKPAPRR